MYKAPPMAAAWETLIPTNKVGQLHPRTTYHRSIATHGPYRRTLIRRNPCESSEGDGDGDGEEGGEEGDGEEGGEEGDGEEGGGEEGGEEGDGEEGGGEEGGEEGDDGDDGDGEEGDDGDDGDGEEGDDGDDGDFETQNRGGGKTYSGGRTTHHDFEGEGNACEVKVKNSDLIVALAIQQFDEGPDGEESDDKPNCGRKVKAMRGDRSVVVKVVDSCRSCGDASLDLSPAAFQKLEPDLDVGELFDVTWVYVD
ncbi:mitogen activated protein kinase 2 [Dimargaris xerosporica]|nr:mitogen activated protein kinase 2 [Dimargaris xerosporica]